MQTETYWSEINTYFQKIKGIGFLLIPIALFFVPVEWLDRQNSVCIFNNIFGVQCYGCGMTRAVISALQFKFSEAYKYNPLVIIVLPLLIYIWAKLIFKTLKKKC